MSRRPEFDRRQVLREAMLVFWAEGYSCASVKKLSLAMGLLPGSIYSAFGSKEALFREALELYLAGIRARAAAAELGPRAFLRAWFDAHIKQSVHRGRGRGCLLMNSAAESPALDAASSAQVQEQVALLQDLFTRCVTAARDQDQPSKSRPPEDDKNTARGLVATIAGISALSRAQVDTAFLHDAAAAVLATV